VAVAGEESMNPSRIIGAGLSGLIAAHAWPNVPVIEESREFNVHRALLRFRSDAVARLTGIDFKKVLVRKGVWWRGAYRSPTIALANEYSLKVLNMILGDRSIWNLDPVERWIAPEDFQERLVNHVGKRIRFGTSDDFKGGRDTPFVSTAPMPVALNVLGIHNTILFNRAAIDVTRYRVPRCNAHQTVYFPDLDIAVYRASITDDVLIIERIVNKKIAMEDEHVINVAFGIRIADLEPLGRTSMEFGKIVNLPDARRKTLMFMLTHEHGLYSLGRFAQWRNILLDDVVKDIHTIKKLMASGGAGYELNMTRA
jgi:hypothetical protein